jgi:hypothetical protein
MGLMTNQDYLKICVRQFGFVEDFTSLPIREIAFAMSADTYARRRFTRTKAFCASFTSCSEAAGNTTIGHPGLIT